MLERPLEEALERPNRDRSFEASVLVSGDGSSIATVPSNLDTGFTAAMIALLRSVRAPAPTPPCAARASYAV